MKRYIGLGVAVALFVGMVATAFCEEPAAAKKEAQTKTGVVKKVDVAGKSVVVMVKRELTFTVTDDTKILQGDAAKTLADVKEGDTVTVDYTHGGGDSRVASKIAIAVPPAPAAAPAPAK